MTIIVHIDNINVHVDDIKVQVDNLKVHVYFIKVQVDHLKVHIDNITLHNDIIKLQNDNINGHNDDVTVHRMIILKVPDDSVKDSVKVHNDICTLTSCTFTWQDTTLSFQNQWRSISWTESMSFHFKLHISTDKIFRKENGYMLIPLLN